jgi:hypothetical protein
MLAAKRGVGIGQWVTTGNEMDVTIADAIDHLSEDPSVSVIGCTAEGVRDGEALLHALERAHDAGNRLYYLRWSHRWWCCGSKPHGALLSTTRFERRSPADGAFRVAATKAPDVLYGLNLRRPLSGWRLVS